MKLLFAGTPEIAVPSLESLVTAGYRVDVDAASGRGGKVSPSPVKTKALELGLVVHQPARLDASARLLFEGRFDLLVSFAYGRIFGPLFLGLFPQGGVNVHPSLLPRWRGPSPLSAAILAGDAQTGICVQRLAEKMDCGDVLVRLLRPLDGTETMGSLSGWAATAAAPLLLQALDAIRSGKGKGISQDESEATYCNLISKEDGRLDWSLSAAHLDAQIRAMDPWPGAFTGWNGQRLTLRRSSVLPGRLVETNGTVSVDKSKGILIQTGDGLLTVRELQMPGRKSMDFRSFLNGNPALVGSRLGEPS